MAIWESTVRFVKYKSETSRFPTLTEGDKCISLIDLAQTARTSKRIVKQMVTLRQRRHTEQTHLANAALRVDHLTLSSRHQHQRPPSPLAVES